MHESFVEPHRLESWSKTLGFSHLLSCVNTWQILKFLWHQNGNSNFILKLILVDRLNFACLNLVSNWRQYLNYMRLNCLHTGCCPHWNTKMAKMPSLWISKEIGLTVKREFRIWTRERGWGEVFTFEWSYFGNVYRHLWTDIGPLSPSWIRCCRITFQTDYHTEISHIYRCTNEKSEQSVILEFNNKVLQ